MNENDSITVRLLDPLGPKAEHEADCMACSNGFPNPVRHREEWRLCDVHHVMARAILDVLGVSVINVPSDN